MKMTFNASNEDAHQMDFRLVAEAVQIKSSSEFTFGGEPRLFSGAPLQTSGQEVAAPIAEFMEALQADLYLSLYCRQSASNAGIADFSARRDHIAALSSANCGSGSWEPGWKIVSIGTDGRFGVTRDNLIFWASNEELQISDRTAQIGSYCRIRVTKEKRYLNPGFYYAVGDSDGAASDDRACVLRLYWHLSRESAPNYMHHITRKLNSAEIPFRTKVLADPASYVRADAGVLYIEPTYFPRALSLAMEVYDLLRGSLGTAVPMFTKKLMAGLSFAEDPGTGDSFGKSRCKLLADGLWDCFLKGETSIEARTAALQRYFINRGIDPHVPYLNRGTPDPAVCFRRP
jgi:HopA1 effector protein family